MDPLYETPAKEGEAIYEQLSMTQRNVENLYTTREEIAPGTCSNVASTVTPSRKVGIKAEGKTEERACNKGLLCILAIVAVLAATACFAVLFIEIATFKSNSAAQLQQLNQTSSRLEERVMEWLQQSNTSHSIVHDAIFQQLNMLQEKTEQLNASTTTNNISLQELNNDLSGLAENLESLDNILMILQETIRQELTVLQNQTLQLNASAVARDFQIRVLDERVVEGFERFDETLMSNSIEREAINQELDYLQQETFQFNLTTVTRIHELNHTISTTNERVEEQLQQIGSNISNSHEATMQQLYAQISELNDSVTAKTIRINELNYNLTRLDETLHKQINDQQIQTSQLNNSVMTELQELNQILYRTDEMHFEEINNLQIQTSQLNVTITTRLEELSHNLSGVDERFHEEINGQQTQISQLNNAVNAGFQELYNNASRLDERFTEQFQEIGLNITNTRVAIQQELVMQQSQISQLNESAAIRETRLQELGHTLTRLEEQTEEQLQHINITLLNSSNSREAIVQDLFALQAKTSQLNQSADNLYQLFDQQLNVFSCADLPPSAPSGYYLIRNSALPVYCAGP